MEQRRGRIKKAAGRVFILNGAVISTRDVVERAYARQSKYQRNCYRSARRTLKEIAVPVGRAAGMGRPMLWQLKPKPADIKTEGLKA